jgi:hypothetical protein
MPLFACLGLGAIAMALACRLASIIRLRVERRITEQSL